MKTLILGYADDRGISKAQTVLDCNTSQADQIKFMSEAKSTGKLPDGLARLEFVTLEAPHTIALRWGNAPKQTTKPEPVVKIKTLP